MDKFNVIDITDNLDKLNQDMHDWSFLPMSLKMRSNDECIRRYGMTVTTLYNKLKMDIMNKDIKFDIPSNIERIDNSDIHVTLGEE